MTRAIMMGRHLLAVTLTALLVACAASSPGGAGAAPKVSKGTLKGTWQVTDMRFVGAQGLYKAVLFERADSACFKGSEWVFIPNNGAGKFTLNSPASQCAAGATRIHWSLYQPGDGSNQFQFKYLDERGKVAAGGRGYRATIDALTPTSMILRVPSSYQGNPFDVLMSFSKVSDDITL
jgi:hypothetical protein